MKRATEFLVCSLAFASAAAAQTSADAPETEIVSTTDLAAPFHARSKWQFVTRQDPPQDAALGTVPGNLHFCFVNDGAQNCVDSDFNVLGSSQIEYPTPTSHEPVLVVELVDQVSVTGGGRATLIWAYNAKTDRFEQIFDHAVNRNTNGEIRLITSGPLAGAIVMDSAGGRPTYRYHITVYRIENSDVREVLSYDGNSKYNDGNPMPVIDAEMPEIERRLHLWNPGDPLPTPVRTQCSSLVMKHGVEWCAQ